MDVDDIVRKLPRDVRRSEASVLRHIAAGALVPVPNEFGRHWFTRAAFDGYVAWLRSAERDGRLRRFGRSRFRDRWSLGRRAAVLFRDGYTTVEAADELGYTADYVAKLWKRYQITPAIKFARLRRRLLLQIGEPGVWVDFREVYRAIHVPARDAAAIVDELVQRGDVERAQHGRRVSVRRLSQIPD
jgi:hypothetical protein